MPIAAGEKVPSATLMEMTDSGPNAVKTDDLFAGKTVALFAVPGAFTPTCSAKHLPGFIEKSGALHEKGVDEIVCLAVNDVFVMDAWGKSAGAGDHVRMLADGNGDFTRALGLEFDGSQFGMGLRSQRFSFIAKDGVITELFVEDGGEFRVSSAEHMLQAL
ncbi:MAG: peroxiredoxin [Rhodothalassiaceae bacterium]